MKRVLLLFIALLSVTAVNADNKKKKPDPKVKTAEGIEWISFEEAEQRMKKEPRKVWIDVYTDWCGWCKVLDKKVFANSEVINYMNKKFYAIKFNAEGRDSINFMGKKWGFVPQSKVNELAVQLMKGQMSYPTSVIMTENFQDPQPIPGYLPVPQIEAIMKYLGEDTYKTVQWEEHQKTFKPQWKELPPMPSDVAGPRH